MNRNWVVFGAIIVILVLSGCSSDSTYRAPEKIVNSVPANTNSPSTNVTPPTPSNGSLKVYAVGELVTDKELSIKVNSVKFVKNINEKENQFLQETAATGKRYAVVDISVTNLLSDKKQSLFSFSQMELRDADGYSYEVDSSAGSALTNGLTFSEILPADMIRGQIAFLVPESSDLKFYFQFDILGSTTAVFNLPNSETRYSMQFDAEPSPKGNLEINTVKYDWTSIGEFFPTVEMEVSGAGSISNIDVSVTNSGDVSFLPAFDIKIKKGSLVYDKPDATSFTYETIKPGQSENISIYVGQILNEDGVYTVEVNMRRKGDTAILSTATKSISVK